MATESKQKTDYDLCDDCYQQQCITSDCKALRRIVNTLKSYQESKSIELNENDDNNVKLLNDFHHLLSNHDQDINFEVIYNNLVSSVHNGKACKLSNCIMMRRNHRDRSLLNNNLLQELYHTKDVDEVIRQQLLDRVHCHYLHSFDIGYRLKQKEKQNIINHDDKSNTFDHDSTVIKMRQIISNKQNEYKNTKGLERLSNTNNKFVTDKSQSTNMYSFGYRYFYWDYYKENTNIYDDAHIGTGVSVERRPKANDGAAVGCWYISKKYKHLKEELMTNKICSVNASQFQYLLTKAQIHINTDKCKQMKCARNKSAECYEMKQDDPITVNHIIAMMAYCNFDELQRKFSETFRYLQADEKDDSLIRRHQNYYHLGKLLREMVELFGTSFHKDSDAINVYHGINTPLTFASISAYIKGPFSTTIDYSVAVNFCNNAGIILNLQFSTLDFQINRDGSADVNDNGSKPSTACIDCQWISDYCNEQELFFIGGLNRFEFRTIINATVNRNYALYMEGLRLLDKCATIEALGSDIDLQDISNQNNLYGVTGIILTLAPYCDISKCLNVSWMSSFDDEDERLFIGGRQRLQISSISIVENKQNYKHFVKTLSLFGKIINSQMLSKDEVTKVTKTDYQVIHRLIKQAIGEYNTCFKTFVGHKNMVKFNFVDKVHSNYFDECFIDKDSLNDKIIEWITNSMNVSEDIMKKLQEYVNALNKGRNENIINLKDINQCFTQNNINYCYFRNHQRKDFVELLRRYNIKIAAAIKLWKHFAAPTVSNNGDKCNMKMINIKDMQKIVNSTLWHKIQVFNKANTNKTTLTISNADFILNVTQFIDNINNMNPIPIATNSEYVWIVRIYETLDVGISFKYNEKNDHIEIHGIHLDEERIRNQLVVSQTKCDCLDNFISDVDELIITNSCYATETANIMNDKKGVFDLDLEMLGQEIIDLNSLNALDDNKYEETWSESECENESIYLETDWEQWRIDETDDELDEKVDDMDDDTIYVRLQQ